MNSHSSLRGWRRLVAIFLAAGSFALPSLPAAAGEIVVGQITPLTGVLGNLGQQLALGAKLWFEHVNAQGGVNGQKIRHIVLNDTFNIPETLKQTEQLIEKEKPAALIGYLGSITLAELIKNGVLQRSSTALIAPYSGSPGLRNPMYPWYFHIRASYAEETAYIADHLSTIGIKKVAVLYQDDAFGQSGLAGFEAASKKYGTEIVARGTYQLAKPDLAPAVSQIAAARPQAVIMIANTRPAALFAKAYRQASGDGILFNISTIDPAELVKLAGLDAVRGMGITQIMPYPFSGVSRLVKEFQADFKKYAPPEATVTYAVFEEYVGARVLTEALQRSGKNPTGQGGANARVTGQVRCRRFRRRFLGQQPRRFALRRSHGDRPGRSLVALSDKPNDTASRASKVGNMSRGTRRSKPSRRRSMWKAIWRQAYSAQLQNPLFRRGLLVQWQPVRFVTRDHMKNIHLPCRLPCPAYVSGCPAFQLIGHAPGYWAGLLPALRLHP